MDSSQMIGPRKLVRRLAGPEYPRFSICTLVTRWDEYEVMRSSFERRGFDISSCEYLVLENIGRNTADAYVGTNEFLQSARGEYVVLCHQDIILLDQGRGDLEVMLEALSAKDPNWALCGNAGNTNGNQLTLSLSHPYKDPHVEGGPFPARVVSLDENFIVVRKIANLAVSRDLAGFHHYGPDLCMIADILGWSAYVISFFLRHNSRGTLDASYTRSQQAITAKYRRAFRSRWIHLATLHSFYVSANVPRRLLATMMHEVRLRLRKRR